MKKCALISNFFPKKAKAGGVVSPTSTTTKQGSSSVLVVATSGTSNSSTGSTHHTAPPPNAMDVVVVQDDDDDNDDVVESFEKKQEICVVMAACASSRDLDVKGTEHDGMAVLESTPLGTTAAETAAPPDDDQDVVEVLSPELAKNEHQQSFCQVPLPGGRHKTTSTGGGVDHEETEEDQRGPGRESLGRTAPRSSASRPAIFAPKRPRRRRLCQDAGPSPRRA